MRKKNRNNDNKGLKIVTIIVVILVFLIIFVPFIKSYIESRGVPSYKKYHTIVENNGYKVAKDKNTYCNVSRACYKKDKSYIELDYVYSDIYYFDIVNNNLYDSKSALNSLSKIFDNKEISIVSKDINSIINSITDDYYFSFEYLKYHFIINVYKDENNNIEYIEYYINDNSYYNSKAFPSYYSFDIRGQELDDFKNGIYNFIFNYNNDEGLVRYKDYLFNNHNWFIENNEDISVYIQTSNHLLSADYDWSANKEYKNFSGILYDEKPYYTSDKYDSIRINYNKEYFINNFKFIVDRDITYFENKLGIELDKNYIFSNLYDASKKETYTINKYDDIEIKLSEIDNKMTIEYLIYK